MRYIKTSLLASVAAVALSFGAQAQSAGSNSVWLDQSGASSTADITQSGTNNRAGLSNTQRIVQGNTSAAVGFTDPFPVVGTGGNQLTINQSGANNVIGQVGTSIESAQIGTSNTLAIQQGGSGNQLAYRQFGINNGNVSFNGPFRAGMDPSYLSGSGALWNFVGQSGSDNQAVIEQGKVNFAATQGGININQTGTNGRVFLNNSEGSYSLAYMSQGGTDNSIALSQSYVGANGLLASVYNLADLRQTGTSNRITGDQRGNNLDLRVTQSGDGNNFFNRQNATNSAIVATQSGLSSKVYAFQGASFVFGIDFASNGAGLASFNPGWSDKNPSLTTNARLDIVQTASSSQVIGQQIGSTLRAGVTQAGLSNGIAFLQDGAGHQADLFQNGGSGNNILLSQTGGLTAGNMATVTQGAANANLANALQSGNGNQLNVKQN